MNQVIHNIMTRRSIRSFTDQPIAKEDIEVLVKCGLTAPSGVNRQTWTMTAILDQDLIVKIYTTLGRALGSDKYNMYQPTALIIPSNDRDSKWGRDDNACAVENILLASHSMGIGSIWLNQFVDNCDVPEVRQLLTELDIPEHHVVYGIVALGYSATAPQGEKELKGTYKIFE